MATMNLKISTVEWWPSNDEMEATIYAADADITYELLKATIYAADADITYTPTITLQGTIYAADADVTFDAESLVLPFLPATSTAPVIEGPTLPNTTASLMPMNIDAGTPGAIGIISVTALPSASVGLARQMIGDVYWRIWCVPSFLRPSNPERSVDIPFTVWMAYPTDNTLTSIGGTGQTGLTLDLAATRDFFSCEELVVNLQIGESAPVNISALYLFNFTTGQGVFLFETSLLDWLWAVPEEPVTERWEWRSDVIRAWDSTEQRISVRKYPRCTLEFTFILEDDAARARELHRWYSSLAGSIILPFYQYSTRITAASAITDTQIYFDPDATDMRDGEYVVIYRASTETSYLLKLDTVEVDGAMLDSPLTAAIEVGDYVAPAFDCRLENQTGPHMSMVHGELIVRAFVLGPRSSFTRPGSSAIIATFDSLNVLERRPMAPVDEVVNVNTTIIDAETGLTAAYSSWLHALTSGRRQFRVARGLQQDAFDSMDYWRDFLADAYGQRNSFLMPTWRRDLVLADTPVPGSYQILVEGTTYVAQYWPYDTFQRLQLEAADGTVIWRKISAAEDYPGGTTLLTLETALPIESRWGEDFTVSYLNRVRLAMDEVTLTHFSTHTIIDLAVTMVDQ